ncbi:Alpha/beta-hydrolase [Favolaschia claudopus]|uniref:Carboxylic ester hydrolase n=1 Tax=Favolaschia claudopus TaxID=2862362 RepID=A0AAW0CND2_9AGAR
MFSLLLALMLLPGGVFAKTPIANTSSGTYIGLHDAQNRIDVFKGIRYAGPAQRFAPPTPMTSSNVSFVDLEAKDALEFGDDCPQPPILVTAGIPWGPPLGGRKQNEDCLFINLWRPADNITPQRKKLPILVYIHGGGYFFGAGSEWNGTALVRRSMAIGKPFIFVTFNYRLGVLGFLGSAQVPAEVLNIGLQDQRAALRWIQDNAESFGGDPSKITIAGESAGGNSVHMHLLYPDSKKTFRGAISSSCTSLCSATPACEWHDRPGGAYNMLGNLTGCGSEVASFECLRNLPFDTFWPLALQTYRSPGGGFPPWVTCKGPPGSLIDEYPAQKVMEGDFLDVPLITGTTRNEGNLLIGTAFLELNPQPATLDEENFYLIAFLASQATNSRNVSQETLNKIVVELYSNVTETNSNSSLYNRATQLATEYAFLAPQRLFLEAALAKRKGRQNLWVYEFDQRPAEFPDFLGASHTADLYYLDIGFPPVSRHESQLVLQMQDLYASFVHEADPGALWPRYTEESKIVMNLGEGGGGFSVDVERRKQTDFFNRVEVMEEFGRFG